MDNAELDTFDDGDYTDGPMDGDVESGEETEGQSTEEETVQTEAREKVDTDSQVNLLDEEEEFGREEKEAKTEKRPDKQDEKDKAGDEESKDSTPSEDDAGEDSGEAAEDVRVIKAFSNGKQYEIPETAEIKTKVAGKWEKPTLQELKDNYSGKVAYDRKFTDLGAKVKQFEETETSHTQQISQITDHFKNIRKGFDEGLSGEGDILGGVNYLLDLMGISTVDYNKALFNNMSDELDVYSELTESEREAHWTKRENAYLVKQQESLRNRTTQEQSQADLSSRVNSLREAHSISEEDYVSAEQDLIAGNLDTNPENVIKAAKLTPLLDRADLAIEPYLDQLSDTEADSLSVEIATTLLNSPNMTITQVEELLAETYKVDSIVESIEKKVGGSRDVSPKTAKLREGSSYESFDDWD